MKGVDNKYFEQVELPVNKQDKYLYQIINRLDDILYILSGDKDEVVDEYYEDEKVVEDCNMDEVVPNYNDMTVKELRDIAKDKGLNGYSTLKKDELIETLKECGD